MDFTSINVNSFKFGITFEISNKVGDCDVVHYMQDSCPLIKNILLLDSEGKRLAVKYYSSDWPTHSAKLAFEESLFAKTQATNARTEGNNTIWHLLSNIVYNLYF